MHEAYSRWRRWWPIIAVLTALIGIPIIVAVTGDDGGGRPDSVTIRVDGLDRDTAADDKLVLDDKAQDTMHAAERTGLDGHAGLAHEQPPGVPFEKVARDRVESENTSEDQTSGPNETPEPTTLASPEQEGCRTSIVANKSSRNGARPSLVVLHYTVSPNRLGWSDVLGIVGYFDNPRASASSNYVIDGEGNCALIVPEQLKAWTQGFFNPWSACSFEVINTGTESLYIAAPGMSKLARVVHDCAKRWGIPLRVGATNGCTITRSGVVDHDELGCNNFHHDIRPYSGRACEHGNINSLSTPCIERVVEVARSLDVNTATAPPAVRVWCRKLTSYRRRVRAHATLTPQARANARTRKALIAKRGFECTREGRAIRRAG